MFFFSHLPFASYPLLVHFFPSRALLRLDVVTRHLLHLESLWEFASSGRFSLLEIIYRLVLSS